MKLNFVSTVTRKLSLNNVKNHVIMVHHGYLSAICGNIISFTVGTALSWSSPILPKLNETNTDINPIGRPISDEENSWIGSLVSVGAICGPFIFAFLADKIGRKFTVLSLGAPFLVSYLILAFSEIVELYYVARIIIGVGVGGVFTVMPMYIGEIAEDSNRGALGSVMNCLLTFGLLFSYSVGPYISILAYNILLAVFPACFMVLFFFIALESPHYYVAKGNYDLAEKNLEKLRGPERSKQELEEIKTSMEKAGKGSIADLFKSKGLIKAFVISCALVGFQQMAGINAILFYAQTIFAASGSSMEPEISTIIIGVVLFATSFVTPLFVDKLGRKILLYFSAIGMILSEIPLGLFFYLKDDDQNVDSISWLPVVSLIIFIITYNCGFGPLPWAVMGELFPSNIKSAASSLTAAFCWTISFLVTKFFQTIVDGIGMGPSFWLFAGFCVGSFFFTLFFVIETKGKSLQEIQEILES